VFVLVGGGNYVTLMVLRVSLLQALMGREGQIPARNYMKLVSRAAKSLKSPAAKTGALSIQPKFRKFQNRDKWC